MWADNLFLLCDDGAELWLRVDEIEALFAEGGLSDSSLEWLGNRAFEAPSRIVRRRTNQEFSRVGQMRVLGVCTDDVGSTRAMSEFRFREATRVWHRQKVVLCAKHLPGSERMQRLMQTVGASLLYGSGPWAVTPGLGRGLDLFLVRLQGEIVHVFLGR